VELTIEDVKGRDMYSDNILDAHVRAQMLWHGLKCEMAIHRFMERTGLKHDEITLVVNANTGKVFPQWKGAVAMLPVWSA
jgi:hypothetical protein